MLLAMAVATPVWADYATAVDAYDRGDFKTALRELRPLARQGDAKAQVRLGLMYREGRGVARDPKAAFTWLLRAAKQGRADAQYLVGTMYRRGEGTAQNDSEALAWLQKSARQGHSKAQATLDDMGREAGQPARTVAARKKPRPAAVDAGKEAPKGAAPAKAARTGETDAVLAAMDPPPSEAEAAAINKAAAHGISVRYGSLSKSTQDTDEKPQAKKPFLRPGRAPASIQDVITYHPQSPSGPVIGPEDTAPTMATAQPATVRAAPSPEPPARRQAERDQQEQTPAALQRQAEQGNRVAQRQLAAMYHSGSGVPRDVVKAAQWYRKAALQGDPEAQFVLSGMYMKGEGVPRDRGVALQWLKRAAERGHPDAKARLAGSGG
jgi:hypothetical protein